MKSLIMIRRTMSLCLLAATLSFAQNVEQMTLSHSVIAGGGAKSSSSNESTLTAEGTVGQSAPGLLTSQGRYRLDGGFWFGEILQPTATRVSVDGRITDGRGRGVSSVLVTLTDLSTGEVSQTLTSAFGYFRFEQLGTGDLYLIRPRGKRYSFTPSSVTLTLADNVSGLNFSAVQRS